MEPGPDGVLKVYGTEIGGYTILDDYSPAAPDFKHYDVALGDFMTGIMSNLWFMNNHDIVDPNSEVILPAILSIPRKGCATHVG